MEFKHEFLELYLEHVEDTEPPRTFHIWSAISGVGATLGRRCFLPFGDGEIYPNNYIILVGPPGVRKNTAINPMRKLIRQATSVRLAPTDTGGQRQGLIAAMRGDEVNGEEDKEKDLIAQIFAEVSAGGGVEKLNDLEINVADMHNMYVCEGELGSFLGINSLDLIRFMTKVYDGDDYDYRIKNEWYTLNTPLLSVLGGATPTVIAECLPPTAVGGGFMSRNLLVYGNKKHKHIAWPKPSSAGQRGKLIELLKAVDKLQGPFSTTPDAYKAINALYGFQVPIKDPRFVYYCERRHTHLLKTIMSLCAMRGSLVINIDDVETAQTILSSTEEFMVDALGEYGLSPLSAARQKMLEFIQNSAPAPVPLTTLIAVMKRDMKQVDLMNSIMDLSNSGKVKRIPTDYGEAYLYIDKNDKIKTYVSNLALETLALSDEGELN